MSWMTLPVTVLNAQPHAADDAGLLAMMNVVVADEVAADGFLVPAVLQRAADAFGVGVGGAGQLVLSNSSLYLPSATPQHFE